ncbi:MAG: hypothetical protein WAO95_01400 [Burkholderiales bacterium]
MKIGLIQTAGLGDIVIALPIAKTFADAGHQVFWPVNEAYCRFLPEAAPYVTFIPVPRNEPVDFHLSFPRRELASRGCDRTFVLYNSLFDDSSMLERKDLVRFLKFDEYKYAVTGVPFAEKWRLQVTRNIEREKELHTSLGIGGAYICIHRQASNARVEFGIPSEWREFQIVEVDGRGTPFDWIYTFERAAKLVCIDSVFSNLIEQLNLPNEKHLFLRMPSPFCAVMKNGWRMIGLEESREA